MRIFKFGHILLLSSLWITFLAPQLGAQTSTAEVNGTVKDSSGAVLAGATIKLTNEGTQVTNQATTNSGGYFVLPNIAPGTYVLSVEKQGFKTAQLPAFQLNVNQNLNQNITMQLGTVTETVEVNASGDLIQASSSELGSVIEEKAVTELPLNGRNITQLLALTPGATPINTAQGGGVSFQDAGPSGIPNSQITKPSMHGQQNRSLLYFQDGFINTDLRGPIYGVLPIIDTVQEFKIQAHNDKAEYGGVTGGIVNIVSKSGTNTFHGAAWEYLRNNAFDARNPFTDLNGNVPHGPAPFHQNEFGAAVGGPIKHDRTFFYAGYEGWRYSQPTQALAYVPTAAELAGDFTGSPSKNQIFNPYSTRSNGKGGFIRDPFMCDASGNPLAPDAQGIQPAGTPCNKIPSAMISPAVSGFLKAYLAAPNFSSTGNNYVEKRPTTDDADTWQVKIDHRFNDTNSVYGRFTQMLVQHVSTVVGTVETQPSNYHANNYGGGYTHIFTPSLIATVSGGVLQKPYVFNQASAPNGFSPIQNLGFNNLDTFKGLVVTLGSPWAPSTGGTYDIGNRGDSIRRNPDWSANADLNWLKGKHNLKFGYGFIYVARDQINTFQTFGFSGALTQNPANTKNTGLTLAQALLGLPTSSSGELPTGGEVNFRTDSWSIYGQDEWKLRPNLTINYGLRWDVLTQPVMGNNRLSNGLDLFHQQWIIGAASGSIPACNTTQQNPCFPGAGLSAVPFSDHIVFAGTRNFMPGAVYDNIGPRLGVAWEVAPKTVLRGGYGLFFDGLPARSQYVQNDIEAAQWPWVRAFSGNPNNTSGAGSAGIPLVSLTAASGNTSQATPADPWNSLQSTFFDQPGYKDGWSQEWNVQVQRELGGSSVFTLGYVGSHSGRLAYTGNANAANQAFPQGTPLATVDAARLIPWMNPNLHYTTPTGYANYHSLQTSFQKRVSHGVTTLVSYTWSKSLDDTSGYFGVENGAGNNGSQVSNFFDPRSNYSYSGYDVPHFLSWFTLWDLPFGHSQRWLTHGPAAAILGDWQLNYIFQIRSGQPINLNVGGDPAFISGGKGSVTNYARPDLVADPYQNGPIAANPDSRCQTTISQGGFAADQTRTATTWFNPCSFALPVGFGDFARNGLRSSHFDNVDFSVIKNFHVSEEKLLQFRAEAFNVLNIQNLAAPASGQSTIGNSGAGRITSIIGNPRQLQFALRFQF